MSNPLSQMSQQEYAEYLIHNASDPNIKVYDLLTARPEQRGWSSQQRVDLYLNNKNKAKDFTSRMEELWLGFSTNKEKGIDAIGASSGWTNFLIGKDSHIKNTDRFKSYATLAEPFNISNNDYADFLRGLENVGYNGQVKFPGTGSRALTSFDNIVMHGSSENDAKISEQFARTFFGKNVTGTQFGVDSNGASHTQLLSDWVEKERKNKKITQQTHTQNQQIPVKAQQTPTIDIPANMTGKSSQFNPSLSSLKKKYTNEINGIYSEGLFTNISDSSDVASRLWGGESLEGIRKEYKAKQIKKPIVNNEKVTHQAVDKKAQSGVDTKTSTINNHKKVHKDVEENSIKNFFGSNRLKGFDTETTGLDTTNTKLSKRDRIWQVGLATEGIGGVEEHTNPFFTSKADGSLEQSTKMSKPYLVSALKHGNGKFSQTAFEQGNFNEFIGLYEKGGLSTLDNSIKNTLGTLDSKDVVVLQNMNFENRMLRSSLEQGILSNDVYEDIASRMMTVDLNPDGSVNTLLQRPAKVQEQMRKADMLYHTEYLNNMSEDSFQTYRQTVNNAIAEYSTVINDSKRVGAVAVELQDLSKAFLANAANRGLIDKSTSTLGLNIDFLSNAVLGRAEKHTALQDSKDTVDLFKTMWSMNSELNSGAELSENTLETLSKIKSQQPDEINKRFLSSVKSVINDFKEKSYTNIGDKYSWYNPEVTLAEKRESGTEKIVLDRISTTSKKPNYSLPEALNNVQSRYSRFANNINSFDREAFTQGIVSDFNSGVDYSSLHNKVDNFKLPESNASIGGTQNILSESLENKVQASSSFWDNKTSLLGKEMKVRTKASILGGIGAGLAYMALTPTPAPTPDRNDNVSTQFYDEQYLGTAFVDFKERNKHYMM